MSRPRKTAAPKRINLALQGGGAHGAYTWGVLDQILSDPRIEIAAVSGTSAGAVNAIVMAEGMAEGGARKARKQLHDFWQALADFARFSPLQRSVWDVALGHWSIDDNPWFAAFDAWTHAFSPYQNPLYQNPLGPLIEREVDFSAVARCTTMAVHIAATNVHTGELKLFSNRDVTLDAVLASACLPHIFRAVEIDGVPHWDGGFAANPPLTPFLDANLPPDIVLVQINPRRRLVTPRSSRAITNRANEITFNGALIKDLEHIAFVNELIRRGDLKNPRYRLIHLHRIGGDGDLAALEATSKYNVEWAFLEHLRDLGRADAKVFINETVDRLGECSTLPLEDVDAATTRPWERKP
jgi:NTE family protein